MTGRVTTHNDRNLGSIMGSCYNRINPSVVILYLFVYMLSRHHILYLDCDSTFQDRLHDLCFCKINTANLAPALHTCLTILAADTASLEATERNFLYVALANYQSTIWAKRTYRMLLHHRVCPDNTSLDLAGQFLDTG